MTRVYYKDAAAAFVVFDLTRKATLEAAAKWKEDLDMKVMSGDDSKVPAILLANKCDMPSDQCTVSDETINNFATQNGFTAWYKVSAKEGTNVEEAGDNLVSCILAREDKRDHLVGRRDRGLVLEMGSNKGEKKKKCC